jgi:hypothetical protein
MGTGDAHDALFGEIKRTSDQMLAAEGYKNGSIPGPVEEAIDRFIGERVSTEQNAGFVIVADVDLNETGFACGDMVFYTGPIIARGIAGSQALTVFTATAGPAIDEWSRRASKDGDLLLAYIVDSAGSVIVEELADRLERIVGHSCVGHGFRVSRRYSPGYCGWNVSEQKKLFSFLPRGFCGISLTDSSLMVPIKSVSGIMGIGREAKRRAYECMTCDRKDCIMLKFKQGARNG